MAIDKLPNTPNVGSEIPKSLWDWLIKVGDKINQLVSDANIVPPAFSLPAHKTTHAAGGSDALTPADIGAAAYIPGEVRTFAFNSPPSGWLKCNGQAVSRTTYTALFAAIGTTFGTGNGSTTFNVPETRGEFIRGWDDGRGVDSGRTFGSAQGQDVQPHSHMQNGNTAYYNYPNGAYTFNSANSVSFGSIATANSTGSETRPRNIALLYCIKY